MVAYRRVMVVRCKLRRIRRVILFERLEARFSDNSRGYKNKIYTYPLPPARA